MRGRTFTAVPDVSLTLSIFGRFGIGYFYLKESLHMDKDIK